MLSAPSQSALTKEVDQKIIRHNIREGATGTLDLQDPAIKQRMTTSILDATIKHTGMPSDEDSLSAYQMFIHKHWAEEKSELIKAYHLDQAPNIRNWSSVFMDFIKQTDQEIAKLESGRVVDEEIKEQHPTATQ